MKIRDVDSLKLLLPFPPPDRWCQIFPVGIGRTRVHRRPDKIPPNERSVPVQHPEGKEACVGDTRWETMSYA
jgi:hypothetical protein